MMTQYTKEIYKKKKRRVLGKIMKSGEVKSPHAWLHIHSSSKEQLITYESSGLVAAINGSGTLALEHAQCQEATKISQFIIDQGGIVTNGGRSSGIMAASAKPAEDQYAAIVFPEIEKDINDFGAEILVNSPQPRIELLGTCAPINIFFRGGMGTMMMLMRAIVHIRNREYHPEQLLQMVLVSNYWIGLLSMLMNLGTLPKEFLKELIFFDSAEQIIKNIPEVK